ncbi:Uma2 family endonuclease [Nocardioides sp. W3-2-3]|uniref:Uma2 family endonuclease n=1 Tax=Nocardioides convexus TaxID=2712224 RepID=UPI002418730D|nr:Uma2 family endonuclease [Nocardioides convexus]NHA01714.1 Uma2 family endonuclease [Nocardioides convexus]
MTIVRPPVLERGDVIVREGPFTIAERDAIPENGYRHEPARRGAGDVAVTACPPPVGRRRSLYVLLKAAVPRDLQVFLAPFDLRLGERTAIQPDIVVVRRADVTEEGVLVAPLLAVEVHSPSTRTFDLGPKKEPAGGGRLPGVLDDRPGRPGVDGVVARRRRLRPHDDRDRPGDLDGHGAVRGDGHAPRPAGRLAGAAHPPYSGPQPEHAHDQ